MAASGSSIPNLRQLTRSGPLRGSTETTGLVRNYKGLCPNIAGHERCGRRFTAQTRATPREPYSVRIRGPSSVTATVCSQCAAREPSVVTTVQSSDSTLVFVVPSVSMGSMAKTDPGSR